MVHTTGSTYRKPGALMLIAADGQYAGLASGGCLESICASMRCRSWPAAGPSKLITYDTRGTDDLLWGLGVGCEGAMQILLLRVGPESAWQPLDLFVAAHQRHERVAAAVVVASPDSTLPAGSIVLPDGQSGAHPVPLGMQDAMQALLARALETGRTSILGSHSDALRALAMPLALPPRLLLLGAGPDAQPLVDFAARLAWRITVYDHRPAYAQSERFPGAEQVTLGRPESVAQTVDMGRYDAAIVMSHHLPSDLIYLRVLSATSIPSVGLLGPVARREKLLGDLGSDAARLNGRLRSPIGLNIGGRAPESIALSIVAEIHARLHEAPGGPF